MGRSPTAWSYSRYNDYTTCAAKYRYKYVEKIPEPENEAMERGGAVHLTIAQYLRGDLPPNDPIPGWTYFEALYKELRDLEPAVEQEWGFTNQWRPTSWYGDDTWFRSKLDTFQLYEDHTADIVDFKTGKPRQETALQAELYAISAFAKYRQLRAATVRFWYVDLEQEGKETVFRFTREMAADLVAKWTKRAEKMLMDKILAPNPAFHCKWCTYAKKKGGPCKYG